MLKDSSINLVTAPIFDGEPTIENIVKFVADNNRITSDDIIGHSRKAHILEARYDAIKEVYERHRDLSLTDIGIAFGGRNYATIRKALEQRDVDAPVSGIIDRDAVVADAKSGMTVRELAHKYHCSRPSVEKILYGAKVTFKP